MTFVHRIRYFDSVAVPKVVVSAIILIGIWTLSHPYKGLHHDALLYSFQALSRLYPDPLRHDVFFAYGSQDDFSLFSHLYAGLIAHVGLDRAMGLVVMAGQAVWLLATWKISAHLPSSHRLAFLVLLFALPADYATSVFGYGEMFPTARIVAEALTLAALAATLAGRPWISTALIGLAVTQHPLMAGGGILLLFLFWGLAHRRGLLIGSILIFCVAVVVTAALGLTDRLSVMDPQWLSLVRARMPYALITAWPWSDQSELVLQFCALWLGWRFCRQPLLRRLFLAAFIMGLLALATALLADLVWHCQLLIQIQPMRAFWLLKWLAILAFVTLLWCDDVGNWIPLLLATAWFAQDSVGVLVAGGAVYLAYSDKRLRPIPWQAWSLPAGAAVSWMLFRLYETAALLPPTEVLCADALDRTACSPAIALSGYLGWYSATVFLGVLCAGVLHALWQHQPVAVPARASRVLQIFAVAVFYAGLCAFYLFYPPPQADFTERDRFEFSAFTARIPRDAVVYWPDYLIYTWFYLGRPSYYSSSQSAGALFNRDSTFEMKRRADRVSVLGAWDSIWTFDQPMPSPPSPQAARRGLVALCRDPALGFVVLSDRLSDWSIASWKSPRHLQRWWLYDCRSIARRSDHP